MEPSMEHCMKVWSERLSFYPAFSIPVTGASICPARGPSWKMRILPQGYLLPQLMSLNIIKSYSLLSAKFLPIFSNPARATLAIRQSPAAGATGSLVHLQEYVPSFGLPGQLRPWATPESTAIARERPQGGRIIRIWF